MTDVDISLATGFGADTYLSSGTPTFNMGIYGGLSTGAVVTLRRILLRADLSGIPSGKICIAATLKVKSYVSSSAGDFNIYKISDANGDWIEGTKNGTLAGAGEPCWNAKKANGSGGVTQAWAGSAGCSTPGVDYINTVLASINSGLTNGFVLNVPFNINGLAVLQSWFGAGANNGLLFIRNILSVASFYPSEDITESYRPVLTISYDDPTPPTGGSGILVSNILEGEILSSRIVR